MSLLNKLAKIILAQKQMWIEIGNFETKTLRSKLKPINKPIYICGLARSGTTILLEIIEQHKNVATHTYRDFPMLYAPYYWNKALNFLDRFSYNNKTKERSHKDGILVSPKSPEAMEEILWMSFFDNLHNYQQDNHVTLNQDNNNFTQFYEEHIQKLLLAKNKTIYATKNNYNISRIDNILQIFTDAKFIIIVRNPLNHIYSCIKQDVLFTKEHTDNPHTHEYMQLTGHFEFGLNKSPINLGSKTACKINNLFKDNKNIDAWIEYWNYLHQYIYDNYSNNKSVRIIRYEDMCEMTESSLKDIFKFCNLDNYEEIIKEYKKKLQLPSYYNIDLTDQEIDLINKKTKKVAKLFGY